MIVTGLIGVIVQLKRSILVGLVLLIAVYIGFLKPSQSFAQSMQVDARLELCNELTQNAYQAFLDEERSPEVLGYIATTSRQARDCYEEERPARRIWLLEKEIWSLDRLTRNRESCDLVEYFFDVFYNVDETSDEMKGRRWLDRVRCHIMDGKYAAALDAHDEARRFKGALPRELQLSMEVDRLVLFLEAGLFSNLISDSNEILSEPDIYTFPVVRARALQNRAEAKILSVLDQVLPGISSYEEIYADLALAASLFGSANQPDRQSKAFASLALSLRMGGMTRRSEVVFDEALSIASGEDKGEIYILLSRVRAERFTRNLDMMAASIEEIESRIDPSSYKRYEIDILYEKALLDELRGNKREAASLFRVVEHFEIEPYSGVGLRAERIKSIARSHREVLELQMDLDLAHMQRIAGLIFCLLLLVVGVGLNVKRRSWQARSDSTTMQLNSYLEHISTLERQLEEALVGYHLPPDLDPRRVLYLKNMLENPEAMAKRLSGQYRKHADAVASGQYTSIGHLRICAFRLEEAIEGKKPWISQPEGAVRSSVNRFCEEKGIDAPRGIEGVRAFVGSLAPEDFRPLENLL